MGFDGGDAGGDIVSGGEDAEAGGAKGGDEAGSGGVGIEAIYGVGAGQGEGYGDDVRLEDAGGVELGDDVFTAIGVFADDQDAARVGVALVEAGIDAHPGGGAARRLV